ncbi:PsbP-related protein [Methanobacterium sp.]|uniref:PsbP-related protein n=1 Tax=Methanobacterium sp. TaxID=2164 RepID=UPI003C72E24D
MKKYAVLVMAVLAVVVFSSGCTSQGNNTYNFNGISFNYSGNWQEISNIKTQDALVGVGDPDSVDEPTNRVNTLVIVQKVPVPSNSTLKQFYEDTYAKYAQDSTFQTVSNKTIKVNDLNGYENVHKIIVDGVLKEERVIWLEKDGNVYVILCGALIGDFDSQQSNFDRVINSFKIH